MALFFAPTSTFHDHTNAVEAIFRSGSSFAIFCSVMHNQLVECQCVDGNFVFTRVILKGTCKETMGEEELVDPVELRNAFVKPFLEKCKSNLNVFDVTSKWSKGVETILEPHGWNLTIAH
jgi:hypothetical protein